MPQNPSLNADNERREGMEKENITKHMKDLCIDYASAKQALESARKFVNNAECNFENVKNKLGKAMCPKSAKLDESFSIWVNGDPFVIAGDILLVVTKRKNENYSIEIRQ